MFDTSLLRPGDVLLYKGKGIFGLIIQIKSWSKIGHCEVYAGDGYSVASRDGKGVDVYPLRESELVMALRPNRPFKLSTALDWFRQEAQGQGYDWLGLLRFTWGSDYTKGNSNNKQFCSEFVTRFYRKGDLDPFPGADADAVPPAWFAVSPLFDKVWSA